VARTVKANVVLKGFFAICNKLILFVLKKPNLGSAVWLNPDISAFKLKCKAVGIRQTVYANKKLYRSLCGPFTVEAKYVYVPLHLQPEKTTLPLGGWYEEQLLMLRVLRESLPSDIYLYVREHPRQFSYSMVKGAIARDKYFYREMASIPGVVVIPIEAPSDSLIANSLAVATITGSSGWEALKIGKPVLLFGNMWYEFHASCYKVRSVKDVNKALEAIQARNDRDPVEEMRAFLGDLSNYAYMGTNYYENAEKSEYGYQGIIKMTCDSIQQVMME
jgi:hypothetical protein